MTFQIYSVIAALVLAVHYGMNRVFKYDSVKYTPQGLPMHHGESKLTDAFNQTAVANANYGAIEAEDPTQEAYDRYVKSPYE
ncbi:unnamed protein product [Gongylonema pulchrum]|uniref:Uncharacterized protein n=1 Tax=Gongylonema pulchrum TaxID=637853 RepID=A0A3P6R524_9BILA|nr:unnamed protein product [Gongylonema pulchrum]